MKLPLNIYRIQGKSMLPSLRPGRVVLGVKPYRPPRIGDVVVVRHDGVLKIKRVGQRNENQLFLLGDNMGSSTDSRHFGWVGADIVEAKIAGKH